MIGTTIKQSKHLIELGLDPETADMCIYVEKGNQPIPYTSDIQLSVENGIIPIPYKTIKLEERDKFQPMWSLDKLMKLMPGQIKYKGLYYELELNWYDERLYYVTYGNSISDSLHVVCADDYVDGCCEMIAWLLNENIIGCGLK